MRAAYQSGIERYLLHELQCHSVSLLFQRFVMVGLHFNRSTLSWQEHSDDRSGNSTVFCGATAIPTAALRREFASYLESQLKTAVLLGLGEVGMPISSDPIESVFGLAKQHGVGEIRDADRIAIRLPALCGIPTRDEARQVLGISVADQQAIMDRFTSLIKQRWDVLSNPDRLDTLPLPGAAAHVELAPGAENRPNHQKILELPVRYEECHAPRPMHRNRYA